MEAADLGVNAIMITLIWSKFSSFQNNLIFQTNSSRQVISTEVQATLKGKQWPLSCFGPFKEKKNIPNFIEDVSFEECRWNAYEARNQNLLQNYSQQFNQQVQEAQNKMNALLILNKNVIDLIVALYDDEPNSQKSNSFSMGASAFITASGNTTNNAFGASTGNTTNAFGAATGNTSSIFGGATAAPSTGGSIFGSSGGTFGSNTTSTPQQGSVFGGSALKQSSFGQQSSIFGSNQNQTQSQTPANPFASGFGQATAQSGTGGSIFGKPAAAAAPSIFGQSAAPANPFGNASSTGGAFGGQPSIFVQQQTQIQQQQQPGSIFGATVQQTTAQQTSVFGTQPQQPQQNVFGSQPAQASIFGQTQSVQPAPGGSIFGQQNQQPQPQQSAFGANPFGAQPPAAPPNQVSAFGQSSGFGMTQQQPSVFGQPQQGMQATMTQQQTSIFGQQQPPQPQSQPQGIVNQSPFGMQQTIQPQQQINPFTQQAQQPQIALNGTEYSKMEDLSPEDLAQFKAGRFEEGKIPVVPPPKELCSEWTF